MSSWHRQYRGRCIGRVLHFLYYYCGYDVSTHATIGESKVNYHGQVIATYEYLGDTDIPYFTFKAPNSHYPTLDMVEGWAKNQAEKWMLAISEADDKKPEPCAECPKHKMEASIYKDAFEKHVNKQSKID